MTSHLEETFLYLWQELYPQLPLEREVLAVPKRRFRLDFAHISSLVAIEINGGLWVKSKHSSGNGLLRDYEKSNLLAYHGWVTFQLAEPMLTDEWLERIAQTIKTRLASVSKC